MPLKNSALKKTCFTKLNTKLPLHSFHMQVKHQLRDLLPALMELMPYKGHRSLPDKRDIKNKKLVQKLKTFSFPILRRLLLKIDSLYTCQHL